MAIIRAAFDSSKDQPAGITTVAGYLGNETAWLGIEERWNNALGVARIADFHLKDIKHRFNDWVDVITPFAGILAQSNLRSVTASMKDTDWSDFGYHAAFREVLPTREAACLYLLFGVLADDVRLTFDNAPIVVVFDNDWGGKREGVVRVHDAWCRDTGHPGFNIFMKGGVSWDSIPLQAADLIAGLLRQSAFWRRGLDMLQEPGPIDPLSDLTIRALNQSRGAIWSKAYADKVAEVMRGRA
ncbi:hypothetical protein EFV37_21985 [Mesorhizobium loti]|uniref:Uncharacterized protein n=2 Tax=Mesorhizobium jarvisii TaxID=1777867 RepID=A0A6M7TMR8_9HYPH|nr:hypothetical protein A9K72_25690 [Mesorhizobium loti]QKC64657.1 hypothetical protein EB229_21980 [Mesorhizobium jarvisii]QKD10571.1 hypothetical protein EFV37_21985 [Mesorhizobium loti]RJT30561.1 hypothetical protein D3242_24615 [Mesorhizobium jarvisii]